MQLTHPPDGSVEEPDEDELRIAIECARGLAEREMPELLCCTEATVHSRLTRVYKKLGIHGRAELGCLLPILWLEWIRRTDELPSKPREPDKTRNKTPPTRRL